MLQSDLWEQGPGQVSLRHLRKVVRGKVLPLQIQLQVWCIIIEVQMIYINTLGDSHL